MLFLKANYLLEKCCEKPVFCNWFEALYPDYHLRLVRELSNVITTLKTYMVSTSDVRIRIRIRIQIRIQSFLG